MSTTQHYYQLVHTPKNLGKAGYLFSLVTVLILFSHTFIYNCYGLFGFFVMQILAFALYFFDFLTSDSTQHNWHILRYNGFSSSFLFFVCSFNFLTAFIPNYIAVRYMVPDDQSYSISPSHLLPVVVNLVISDVVFYLAHRHLHRHLPHLHVMHHCCRRSSTTTNLFFDPTDLALEFTGPVLCILFLCALVWKDPMVLMLSLSVQLSWYGIDHDEYLRLPHWYHHSKINSNYSIYASLRSHDKREGVRALLNYPEYKKESYEKDNQ